MVGARRLGKRRRGKAGNDYDKIQPHQRHKHTPGFDLPQTPKDARIAATVDWAGGQMQAPNMIKMSELLKRPEGRDELTA